MASVSFADFLLERLETGFPGITPIRAACYYEACVYCLTSHDHGSGVVLEVDGFVNGTARLVWSMQVTQALSMSWRDDAQEFGACAIAVLLILQITPYTVVERARKGTGVDYWLGRDTGAQMFEAGLEISGIMEGNKSSINDRVATKKKQIEPSRGSYPVYIVVAEFSKPQARVVLE